MAEERIIWQEGMRERSAIIHGPDGHSYHFNKNMKGGRLYLRCYLHYKRRCRGAASVDPADGSFKRCGHHNHPGNRFLMHERRFRNAVLSACRGGDLRDMKVIYHETRREMRIPVEAVVNLPFVKLRPSMQRAREQGLPNLPHSLSELAEILSDPNYSSLTETTDGEDSIYAGVMGDSNEGTRCVFLFSRRQRLYMKKVKRIFSDATFCIPPDLGCRQILNIVSVRRKTKRHIIPLGSVLMQSKSRACYRVAVRGLRRLQPRFNPTDVMCDFEPAEQGAYDDELPNAERHGCHYHYTADICDYVKSNGLRQLVQENPHADSIVRSLCAIPLLKKEDILEGFSSVMARAERLELHQLTLVFDYFIRTWLPPYRLRVLSVYKEPHRTSNVCESYNRSLRVEVKRKHPNVFHLIAACVRLEDICNLDLQTLKDGGNPSVKRRASSLSNDEKIAGHTEDLELGDISIGTFLRRASRRIQGVYNEILH